jgi:glycosyltransferase involved in cell wall biosynthesis
MECLKLLIADPHLRESMGRNGRKYVRQNYRWDVILGKYEKMFSNLRQAPGARQSNGAPDPRRGRRP